MERISNEVSIALVIVFFNPSLEDIEHAKALAIKWDGVIVDNSVFCFSNQLSNGILISSFFNDQNDSMLMNLVNYLSILVNAEDVREENQKYFQFQTYLEEIKKGN